MLPKKYRLLKERDFERVYKKGSSFAEKFVVCKILKNDLGLPRFGFSIGTKISKKAVSRNRLRRQFQEIARLAVNDIKNGVDIIVLPKKDAEGKKNKEIKEAFLKILKKSGIMELKES